MPLPTAPRRLPAVLAAFAVAACGLFDHNGGSSPFDSPPPKGAAIAQSEATPIAGATGWTWVQFSDAICTDAVAQSSGAYQFSTSPTGLAISWGSSTDVVIYLQGGGACWETLTCGGAASLGVPKLAATGPFGPDQFAADIYAKYPRSFIRRENLPPSLAQATLVFVPYCTGDVHSGDRVTTYPSIIPGEPAITWHHVGHANLLAFLKRLGATFPSPGKLVVAGSSAGGFGALSNYPWIRWYWPGARAYLIDDSGPPLAGDAIPATTRAAWYASWNIGATLDAYCPSCQTDYSQGLREVERRYPQDRIALLSHLQDEVIRAYFGTITLVPPGIDLMSPDAFESALRSLATNVMDPATANGKYFFPAGTAHPTLEDPTAVTTPAPGLAAWLELMLSDSTGWASAADP
jgi:Pectinacetylesterase